MDKRFLTAFLPRKKYVVGGIKMDGFCPRHSVTLEGINSPLLNGDFAKNYSFKDLYLAMRICSTPTWEEAIKPPSFMDKIRYSLIRNDIGKQIIVASEFLTYITESTVQPKVIAKSSEHSVTVVNNKDPVPPTLSIVVFLMSKMNMSERDAWNMPYSRIAWYMAGYAAQETGEIEIISTDEEEREEEDKKKLMEFTKQAGEKLKGKA